jgi:septation ring formation regulator EzrA
MRNYTAIVHTCVQAAAEKLCKQIEAQVSEANAKLDESARQLSDLGGKSGKSSAEVQEIQRQLEEAESQLSQLAKAKQALQKQLDETRSQLEEESRIRSKIQVICCLPIYFTFSFTNGSFVRSFY